MADDDRKPKRQKLVDAAAEAANAAASAATDACECAFHLTRLKNAPEAHNVHAKSLSDLLEGEFSRCLLTNYMYDLPWLFAECPRLRDVPVLLVHGERDRHGMTKECREYANVTPVAPPLPIAYGTHHTKMLVALYPEKVRVAIFTANFLSNDWDTKTQGVWFQDFGLKVLENSDDEETEAVANSARVNDFEADLVHYLSSLGTPVKLFCGELKRFDFSTAHVALVPSVPGVHKGKDMEKYGHLRVRKLLKMYQVPPTDNPLICQFSSLGSLDEKWLFGEFAESFLPGKKNISPTSMPVQALHIIWPSVEDVRNSLEGWNSGRSIPCPLKNMKPFLHKYLRKWTPPTELHRQNAMPHIKSYARFNPSDEAAGELDWALVTSSNLSKAAWGALQKNKSQFMIRSYELGVLFLPQLLGPADDNCPPARLVTLGSKAAERSGVEVSESQPTELLPLPYGFPLTTYNPKQDKPWVWDLVRDSPDIFGSAYIPH
ncbi:Tyrosyl-DNA phosphodiesterase 1 [Phytophthora cinnamomi]|uniref:Tyrosyl-DNA phosphodiesterase 1 n=1 Tax=Phytophthora cinnamomi TaxID=4785 RepID=UPI00355A976B|nr:Tyrosyl-DNA phosphodiesterase 1 [Phytophthora cinnamomi]